MGELVRFARHRRLVRKVMHRKADALIEALPADIVMADTDCDSAGCARLSPTKAREPSSQTIRLAPGNILSTDNSILSGI